MKKILVVLSLICFVAVNVTNAQTGTPVAKVEKKEAVSATTKADCSTPAMKSCCKKGNMKACTPEEKAKCEVNKSKAEASATEKVEVKSTVKN